MHIITHLRNCQTNPAGYLVSYDLVYPPPPPPSPPQCVSFSLRVPLPEVLCPLESCSFNKQLLGNRLGLFVTDAVSFFLMVSGWVGGWECEAFLRCPPGKFLSFFFLTKISKSISKDISLGRKSHLKMFSLCVWIELLAF